MLKSDADCVQAINHAQIPGQVRELFEAGKLNFAYVGVYSAGRSSFTALERENGTPRPVPPDAAPVRLGCLAKVLLANLAVDAACAGRFSLDQPVLEIIGEPAGSTAWLQGVSMRQLLNHTHGLDGAAIRRLPRRNNGCIDLQGMGNYLTGARRLSAPGEIYNYGRLGAWIAAAILEAVYGARYEEILQTRLFEPSNLTYASAVTLSQDTPNPMELCPGEGGRLAMPLSALLQFARQHSQEKTKGSPSVLMRAVSVGMPGMAVEVGSCLGWRYYGSNWYGHAAQAKDMSSMLLINPVSNVCTVVYADRSAILLQSALFGELFECALEDRREGHQITRQLDLHRCAGTYRNHALSITIESADGVTLQLHAHSASAAPKKLSLKAMAPDTFAIETGGVNSQGWIRIRVSKRDRRILVPLEWEEHLPKSQRQ